MPKLKTHSGTKDRIKVTKNGKVLRRRPGTSHNMSKKSAARKRRFAGVEGIEGKSNKNLRLKVGA